MAFKLSDEYDPSKLEGCWDDGEFVAEISIPIDRYCGHSATCNSVFPRVLQQLVGNSLTVWLKVQVLTSSRLLLKTFIVHISI